MTEDKEARGEGLSDRVLVGYSDRVLEPGGQQRCRVSLVFKGAGEQSVASTGISVDTMEPAQV